MLGDLGTEQFRVITLLDDKVIGDQAIHDPFIYNKTVIGLSRWDLFKAIFGRKFEITVRVRLSASEGAMRAIMTLDPDVLAKETVAIQEERAIRREAYAGMGLVNESAGPFLTP